MNRDEWSYQLSHIYDRLFAATSSSELKLSTYQDLSEEGNRRCRNVNRNKKLSYCWEIVRRESMPRIAEMDVEITT